MHASRNCIARAVEDRATDRPLLSRELHGFGRASEHSGHRAESTTKRQPCPIRGVFASHAPVRDRSASGGPHPSY